VAALAYSSLRVRTYWLATQPGPRALNRGRPGPPGDNRNGGARGG
jgi:hypothetical protein